MKNFERIKNLIIDEFYNEETKHIDQTIKQTSEYLEFKQKLDMSTEKLNILHEQSIDFEIDTTSIIQQAENIKENKKFKTELGIYILISTIFLLSYVAITIVLQAKVFLIMQWILSAILPWIVIPITLLKRKESEI